MQYPDGTEVLAGDLVAIDEKYRGTVVAAIDSRSFLASHEKWVYLGSGVVIDTDFGGFVHYRPGTFEGIVLLCRASPGGRT